MLTSRKNVVSRRNGFVNETNAPRRILRWKRENPSAGPAEFLSFPRRRECSLTLNRTRFRSFRRANVRRVVSSLENSPVESAYENGPSVRIIFITKTIGG